jgi:hypothetical protein
MTWINFLLAGLFLLAGTLALNIYRRYRQLQRKHVLLQQRYEKAERQLTTLWAPRNS